MVEISTSGRERAVSLGLQLFAQ